MNDILTEALLSKADAVYADFTAKLVPNIPRDRIIGVRFPELREIAKRFSDTDDAERFMRELPHAYLDQNNLHSSLISRIKDPHKALEETERFLPYVDNWATCDGISPKCLKKALPEFYARIKRWIASEGVYSQRFAIVALMSFFLGDEFDTEHPRLVAAVSTGEYYIRMAQAWYFATALTKRYDDVLPYIEDRRLETWTHNKSIQKAIESYRVTDEHKQYLRTLKIKTR